MSTSSTPENPRENPRFRLPPLEPQGTQGPEEPKRPKSGNKKTLLLGVWLALLCSLIGGIAWMNGHALGPGPDPKTPRPPMPRMDEAKLLAQWPQIVAHAAAPPRGQANAHYTIAEFGDFQCPQCAKVRPLVEALLQKYPGQVNLIFVHRPFSQMHKWAIPAGGASEIAAAQGKFWPMYDVLYSHQDDPGLETGFYADYAKEAGLDAHTFQKAFDAGQGQDTVKASATFADALGVQTTPTLLVHDNTANKIAVYVGLDSQKNTENGVPYPGMDRLAAQPPWIK